MTPMQWRRHIAHTEAQHLRQLPTHLWHHAHTHTHDLRRWLNTTGRIPRHRPLDCAAIVQRDAEADQRAHHAAWKRQQRATA